MNAEETALYNALPSDSPFKVVLRRAMCELYVDHATVIQRRAFREFLLKLPSIPATSDDWHSFALCDKPSLLGGPDVYQCISVFWSKISEMLARVATPDEVKKIVVPTDQEAEDTLWPVFWDAIYKIALALCVTIGATIWFLIGQAARVASGLFWGVAPAVVQGIYNGAAALVRGSYGLLTGPGARIGIGIAEQAAVLRAPVVAAGGLVFEAAWQAAPMALFFYLMRRLVRRAMIQAGINPDFEEPGEELPLSLDNQIRFLDNAQLTQFRDSLQAELDRTASFHTPTPEEIARLNEYNTELAARAGQPILTDITDPESDLRSALPVSEEERIRIRQIQDAIRSDIQNESKGLSPEEIEGAIRNEAYERAMAEYGVEQPSVIERLPAGAYRTFREYRMGLRSPNNNPQNQPEVIAEPPQLSAVEFHIQREYPNLSLEWVRRLATEEGLERGRLQYLLDTDANALSRALRELDTAPLDTEGGLAVATARRARLRQLAASFEENEVKHSPIFNASEFNVPSSLPPTPMQPAPEWILEEKIPAGLLEDVSLAGPEPIVLGEDGVWSRPAEIPVPAQLGRGFRAITPALAESMVLGAQVVVSVVALIVGIVWLVEDEQAREDAQGELDQAARNYQAEFDKLCLDLNITDLPTFHRNLMGPLDFSPTQSEVPRLFRYGEAGLRYLEFRRDQPTAYPSIEEGLKRIGELWQWLSGGFLRLWPGQIVYGFVPTKSILGLHWTDVLRKYMAFSDERRDQNWPFFQREYIGFLQRHGSSQNLSINFRKNQPPTYWSSYFEPVVTDITRPIVVPAPVVALAKQIMRRIEVVLAILALFIPFEQARERDQNYRPDLTQPSRALPDPAFVQYYWYLSETKQLALPAPSTSPVLGLSGRSSFVANANSKYGTITFTEDAKVVAYSVPALSCILIASADPTVDMLLLTPGASSDVLGLSCNSHPIYVHQDSAVELTISFPTNDSIVQFLTFSGNSVIRCQIGNKIYLPIEPRTYDKPSRHFLDLVSSGIVPEDSLMRLAYMVALNDKIMEWQVEEIPGELELHPEFLRTNAQFENNIPLAYGDSVALFQQNGPAGPQDFSLTVLQSRYLINIQPLYAAVAAVTLLGAAASMTPPAFWAALFSSSVAMGGLLVSKLSPLKNLVFQYLVVPFPLMPSKMRLFRASTCSLPAIAPSVLTFFESRCSLDAHLQWFSGA